MKLYRMGKDHSKLKPRVLSDLKAQTLFSEDEIVQWYRGFRQDCPSGRLSMEGFTATFMEFFPSGNAESFVKQVFHSVDTDHNGTVDFKEFICALSVLSRGTPQQKLKWLFRLHDIDDNGVIAKDELLTTMNVS